MSLQRPLRGERRRKLFAGLGALVLVVLIALGVFAKTAGFRRPIHSPERKPDGSDTSQNRER